MSRTVRSSIPNSLLLFCLTSFLASAQAHTPAPLVLQERATYNGGWALAIPGSSCPADAPVACPTAGGNVNPACCPNGQTCFGLENQHCCPSNAECENVVTNFPVCANATWSMYALSFSSRIFFCCEPGQYGVLPISGYTGICEPVDQPVASSLVATPASQVGATGVATAVVQPGTTGTVTSTLKNGALTTILTTVPGVTATGTTSGTGGGSASTGTGQGATSSSTVSISKGALIAIVVCAIVVPIICLVIFLVFWRKRRAEKKMEGHPVNGGGMVYAAAPPNEKSPGVSYSMPIAGEQRVYGKSELPPGTMQAGGHGGASPAVEVPASRRWDGRTEMP